MKSLSECLENIKNRSVAKTASTGVVMTMNRSALNLAYLTQIRKAIAVMQRGKKDELFRTGDYIFYNSRGL